MASILKSKKGCSVRVYKGDAMNLLCFDLEEAKTIDCVGFSIRVTTPSNKSFFLFNRLSFEKPLTANADMEDREEASTPSDKAPFQKYNWLHVPSSSFDGKEEFGIYKYEVTPRYMQAGAFVNLDADRTVTVETKLEPFKKGKFQLGFTRSFMISQAYARRFGNDTTIKPKGDEFFDTSTVSGKYPAELKIVGGKDYTYADQYEWMGWQAHDLVFNLLDEIIGDPSLTVDVFAYDLDEPDMAKKFLHLAGEGRIRIILDNSSSHVSTDKKDSSEDLFQKEFANVAVQGADLIRGRFSRQSHQKTFIVKKNNKSFKVLSGSTNFAINGLYINANHVLIFENKTIAEIYAAVFEESFNFLGTTPKPKITAITSKELFKKEHKFTEAGLPEMVISFAPHNKTVATTIMNGLNKAIKDASDSVLFAVMSLESNTSGPVVPTLRDIHKDDSIFSYGITDQYDGVVVFTPGSKRGKLVETSKLQRNLPKPFNKEIGTSAHKVHHKFVVLDFKSPNAVVYCGSTNLALLGEQENGDNMLAIHDEDIATAFAIEAFRLIDHYHFRAALSEADTSDPMLLKKDNSWLKDYYKEGHMKKFMREYLIQ
jgi:phosphatidylserine/phosphatidylglycerophosphate/cardiolipin synthase-like enzyme